MKDKRFLPGITDEDILFYGLWASNGMLVLALIFI